ncbi:restriction endonuclease subunit S [Enterococcus thailandicus]|uniref:restriction endonuclease subunit S n=1 Tax=Enterococcus thailandicus TaxID=417368 RepID=UPI0032E4A831
MVDKKVPELRFEGFDGDWEQRKLGEVFQQTVEYIDPKEAGLELWSVTVENGLTPKSERYNREFLVKKNDKFKAIHPDEIVYNPMNMTLGSIGFNNSGKDVAVSGYYVTMKLNEGFDTKYFATWLPSPNAINLYKLYATGSLIERQRVQFPTLSGIKTLMPSLNEQKQIGLFFKQLDTTTALHQQKLDQLKRLKQGFLQILFGNKEQAPKVRFAGFDEEWEQRKLGEVVECFEYGLNAAAREYDGKNKYLRITDIDEETHLFKSEKLTSPDINLSNADNYKLKENDVLFARTGASVGKTYRYRLEDGLIYYAGFLIRARIKSEFSTEFIFQNTLTSKYNQYIKIASQRSGQPGVNAQEYSKFELFVPNLEEQQKIGSFFKQLDDAIALHQTKLEKLKQLKKAFLQKMFI